MAFSTASAPELNSTERFSPEPGVIRLSSSATATYSSYGVTMKQVWVKSATCARTASTTRGDGVADGGDGDARTQVDEPVAVDVLDDAAAGAGHEHRHGDADAARHRRGPALGQFQRCGTGDFGDQLATLLEAGHDVLLTAARGSRRG